MPITEILNAFTVFVTAYIVLYAAASFIGGAPALRNTVAAVILSIAYLRPLPVISDTAFAVSLTIAALLILKKELAFGEFTLLTAGYALVLAAVTGAEYIRLSFTDVGDVWSPVVSGGVAIAISVLTYIMRKAREQKVYYDVGVLTEDGREHKLKGYLDTGNALYSDGEAVVVLSERAAEKLKLKATGYMAVNTVSGVGLLPETRLKYKIYYDKFRHKLYSTPALISDKMGRRGYDVIIHRDMK